MTYQYRPEGVCARGIVFDLEDGVLHNVQFVGGCNGNAQGIAHLVEGMPAAEAMERLRGIRCGFKSTSCPDQFARALEQALREI